MLGFNEAIRSAETINEDLQPRVLEMIYGIYPLHGFYPSYSINVTAHKDHVDVTIQNEDHYVVFILFDKKVEVKVKNHEGFGKTNFYSLDMRRIHKLIHRI